MKVGYLSRIMEWSLRHLIQCVETKSLATNVNITGHVTFLSGVFLGPVYTETGSFETAHLRKCARKKTCLHKVSNQKI